MAWAYTLPPHAGTEMSKQSVAWVLTGRTRRTTCTARSQPVDALVVGDIDRVVPQLKEAALGHVVDDVARRDAPPVVPVADMAVQKRPAYANAAVPPDRERDALDERAHVVRASLGCCRRR